MQPLPLGWEALRDPSQRVYYVHRPSGATQWEHPNLAAPSAPPAPHQPHPASQYAGQYSAPPPPVQPFTPPQGGLYPEHAQHYPPTQHLPPQHPEQYPPPHQYPPPQQPLQYPPHQYPPSQQYPQQQQPQHYPPPHQYPPQQQHPPQQRPQRPAQPPAGYPGSAAATGFGGGASSSPMQGHLQANGQKHAMSAAAAAYVFKEPRAYKLKEKVMSLSGDSFTVKDVGSGAVAFKMKGNITAVLSERKVLYDARGNALYNLTEAMFSLRDRMTIADATTRAPVLVLRKKGVIPMMGTGTIQCWVGGKEGGAPYLTAKGNLLRKSFSITDAAGGMVASVERKSNIRSVVLEKDSYVLRVEPGVDTALMVALAVSIDEHYRDDGNKSGLSSFL